MTAVDPFDAPGTAAVVAPGATVGEDCRFGPWTLIDDGAVVGSRVTVHSGTQIWAGVTLDDDVFVGPNVSFCGGDLPRGTRDVAPRPTRVHRGAAIGAGATILPGVDIGAGSRIGAGAVVTRSVPRGSVVVGNPARIVSYVAVERHVVPVDDAGDVPPGVTPTGVRGVTLLRSSLIRDLRGSLVAGEVDRGLPFVPHRYFFVFDVPSSDVRGEHAHRECHQLLIAAAGSLHVIADDGQHQQEFVLKDQGAALYLPPMTWGIQYRYSPDAVLLALASHPYDADDYIRDYGAFLRELEARGLMP